MMQKKTKLHLCLMALSAFLISNCGAEVNLIPSPIVSATQLTESSTPTIYPSQTATPIKTETPTVEITNTPVDTPLDFGNIKPGQYLLAQAHEYEQDQDFLYFISTEGQIAARLSLNLYRDPDPFGGYLLNVDFAASNDGSRFLIMRPSPKNSYLLNLQTGQWETLDFQGQCSNASWSPDKTIIALECFDTGLSEIHFYNTLSKSFEIVTDCEEKKNICGEPEWSLDGRWLAYARGEARSGPATVDGIYVFDTSCVPSKNCMETQAGPIQSDSNPVWSLDNKMLFAHLGTISSYDPKKRTFSKTNIHLPDATLGIAIKFLPDGKDLAFSTSTTSGTTIYLYSKETNQSDVLLDDHSILWIIGWTVIP